MKKATVFLAAITLFFVLFSTSVFAQTVQDTAPVYRLFNPKTGEHLYTEHDSEVTALTKQGWNNEGAPFTSETGGIAVYRLFNKNTGEHLYTTDTNEKDTLANTGWTVDFNGGGAFYSHKESVIPVYRLYNKNERFSHLLTTDLNEIEVLGDRGWINEGVAFFTV